MVTRKTVRKSQKTTAKTAVGTKGKAIKKGDRYTCAVCGLVVSVDKVCGCVEVCDLVCCGKQMKPKK